jgi:hypothetical protein
MPEQNQQDDGQAVDDPSVALQAAPDAMPPNDALTFLLTEHGRPFKSAAAFGNKFSDWVKAAGLKPVVCHDGKLRSYRFHRLRKGACMRLAHAGCTAPEIMAVSGHDAGRSAEIHHCIEQDQMAEAAIAKLTAGPTQAQAVANISSDGG